MSATLISERVFMAIKVKDTGRYIVKIIHFGSTAKGEGSEGREVYSVKKESLKKESFR